MIRLLAVLLLCFAAITPAAAKRATPQSVADQLLAADRAFAAAAEKTDLISGLTAMLDAESLIAAPEARFARGPGEAATYLRTNPKNPSSKIGWAPVRAAISADGTRGVTYGHIVVTRADGAKEPGKYLAYWAKRPAGWRVLAYQRSRREAGEVSAAMLPPLLPARIVAPRRDAKASAADRASLSAAEKSFSDLAQKIGLGPAFGATGTDDAVLISIGADFVIGARNIQRQGFGPETTSAVSWSSDGTDTASSGDLGLSWGVVRPNPGAQGQPFAFFTVWRREAPGQPWRFIAE